MLDSSANIKTPAPREKARVRGQSSGKIVVLLTTWVDS